MGIIFFIRPVPIFFVERTVIVLQHPIPESRMLAYLFIIGRFTLRQCRSQASFAHPGHC